MTEHSIEELKQMRSSSKGSITRIKNNIRSELSATELECRLGIVESYFKQVLAYQTQIERIEPTDVGRGDIEDLYISTKTKILSALGPRRGSVLETTFSVPQSVNHLQKLSLPKFSGKYSVLKNFINSYKKLVDDDPSLSAIEKFNYLLTCLSGQALGTIRAFQVTEENYPKALTRLKDRYDNDCLIFSENISQLFELSTIPKPSASLLRSLVDNVSALYSSLKSLGSHADICNAVIIYITMSKVDADTQSKWDEQCDFKSFPTWDKCAEVLNKRCQYLEARDSKQLRVDNKKLPTKSNRIQTSLTLSQKSCNFCKETNHLISSCASFSKLSVQDRFANVKKLGLCLNCLGKGHSVARCPSSYRCKTCKQTHHSLLHRTQHQQVVPCDNMQPTTSSAASNSALEKKPVARPSQVILATALVLVRDSFGSFQLGRVLLDSGSQVNFINERFAKILNLQRQRRNIDIVGIGSTETKISFYTQTTIRSRFNNFELSLEFLVAPTITGYQPDSELNIGNWNLPNNIELADAKFNHPSPIDLLLGAEAFFDLLLVGKIKLGAELPSLQRTQLGWIVSGRYKNQLESDKQICCLNSTEDALDAFVEKFWELEAVDGRKSKWTDEQAEVETHFRQTIEELPSGRLMVQLPFKSDPACLGKSFDIAFRRFLALERRLSKNPALKTDYVKFLQEYRVLGHMSLVKNPDLEEPHYYLPHQAVLKPGSVSTKLRVVFDASCCTSSQVSLNSILMAGPTIQDDLFLILLRFRLHRYVLTADIVKMYRQVLIHPADRRDQYILWRENEHSPIQTFQLNTVTYGTTSAPFLAIRSLMYLADKFADKYQLGSKILRSDFYVDDMLTGADDLDTLQKIQDEVTTILRAAGFELSKWHSNYTNAFETSEQNQKSKNIIVADSNLTSTLGITYDPTNDNFSFSYQNSRTYLHCTKRTMLSVSSALFDPMGLLSPIIITAKILLQKVWIEKLDWDAAVPHTITNKWHQFITDLHSLKNLSVPRYVLSPDKKDIQIHGFCDASLDGYGCCIYVRTTDTSGSTVVQLLVAKSRVSPAKKKQLPRLELCAAHLLSKLWSKIEPIFRKSYSKIYFWTDASIVLHWIATHSSKLTTFVGNRIAEIQEHSEGIMWRHVPTSENPADIVSRGCTIQELRDSIWFSGPQFLMEGPEKWPLNLNVQLSPELLTLEKRKTTLLCKKHPEHIPYLLNVIHKYSSYRKVVRIFAYVLRFIRHKSKDNVGLLTPTELDSALLKIIWIVQTHYFPEEIDTIRKERQLKGSIKWLNPFLDESHGMQLLKVGGRLKNANITEEQKYPILLPKDSSFVFSMIRDIHISNFHAGPKSLVALIRQRFWIINARDVARKVVRQCVHCTRYRPKLLQQVMGDLPSERVMSSRPFSRCGVDFCGPIYTFYRIRGKVPYKTYIAVFVCLASKAVHLEAVSDLSANAFIASLKRMIGRRGLPYEIFCDNATNFVGANSKLVELRNMLFQKTSQDTIINFCTNDNINFRFIPPRAPHFGGIWEAAVKVAKGHLYRSLYNAKLTFEELSTALVEIEVVMNSRPISALSTDPNDLQALTPGHLLIGAPLKAIPEAPDDVSDISYLQRWRRINAVKTHFWKRWTDEYVSELQQRSKWSTDQQNLLIDTMVIVHEDNLPPQKWLVGRVTKTFPGQDGKVRVADIRTPRGIIRRPIRKLAILPV